MCSAHERLGAEGATVETLAALGGELPAQDGENLPVDRALPTTASVLHDAVVVPDGVDQALVTDPDAVRFVSEALRHGEPVAALGSGSALLQAAGAGEPDRIAGVALCRPEQQGGQSSFWVDFVHLVEQDRFPQR